ncbi:phosphatase PAP2 family protein [Desulfuribacillus alkaliarsenatis]|uniref:phosphatase PAP2 family protein n=1 Tax=Desulfuribacillus alkaliarsenatis TaxID=766136 RepID=UPI0009FE5FD6|nr:phosphatase PAP2 family protein [Desulfuribacillus alkaliarsenatis]
MNHILSWDQTIFRYINQQLKCSSLDRTMPYFTHFGGARFSILICILLLWLQSGSFTNIARDTIIALAGSHILVQLIKNFFNRPRPFLVLPEAFVKESLILKDYSFPSGHTTASVSIATVFSLYFPIFAPLFFILAAVVGISRIYLGLHYPTDVFIGAVLGFVSALIVFFI